MSILRIPLPRGLPAFSERVMLEQREYVLAMHWNDRAGAWFLLLSDSAAAPIVTRRLALNVPLLRGLVDGRRPPGELIALDARSTGEPCSEQDLGERVVLNYLEQSTLADIAAGLL